MEHSGKINLSLFHWSEIINLGILCFFYDVINHWFFYIYGTVLLCIGVWKIFARIGQYAVFENIGDSIQRCSLLSYIIFLSEFSLIFLCYTEVSISVPFIVTFSLTALMILYINFQERINTGFVVPMFFISLTALVIFFLMRTFSITTELIKITFVLGLIWLFDYRESYLGGFIMLIICCILLVLNGESGSCFILMLGYDIFCFSSGEKKVIKTAGIITSLVIIAWLIIFSTPLYDIIYDMITKILGKHESICDSLHNSMKRVFFHYSSTDQLPLLHSLINNQNIINKLTCTFSPAVFTEIVKYETGSTTSSADYCFSLILYFLGPISGFIIAFSSLTAYSLSIRKNFSGRYRIIPLILYSQTLIHVFGNMMIFPFTGIPYPFLSFGNANLIINFAMIFILTHAELKEGC